jgi:hypothetical protein
MNAIPSRRTALRAGMSAAGGLALALVMVRPVRAADAKLAKATVQYIDEGQARGQDCDDCVQFIPGKTAKAVGSCKIVEGDINPHGHCLAFSPKPKT